MIFNEYRERETYDYYITKQPGEFAGICQEMVVTRYSIGNPRCDKNADPNNFQKYVTEYFYGRDGVLRYLGGTAPGKVDVAYMIFLSR